MGGDLNGECLQKIHVFNEKNHLQNSSVLFSHTYVHRDPVSTFGICQVACPKGISRRRAFHFTCWMQQSSIITFSYRCHDTASWAWTCCEATQTSRLQGQVQVQAPTKSKSVRHQSVRCDDNRKLTSVLRGLSCDEVCSCGCSKSQERFVGQECKC